MSISLAAEPIIHIGDFPVTNSFITGILGTSLVTLLFLILTKKRSKLAYFLIRGFYNFASGIAGEKTREFFPLFFTFFLFILFGNWIGLLPGVGSIGFFEHHGEETKFIPLLRAVTSDLNTTIALALISMSAVQYYGIKHLGLPYFKKFFNFSSPINGFVGILELVSEFSKIISYAFRLFGNVFAGEVLLAVMATLIPVLIPTPFFFMEVFVGFIQAVVFSMLTIVFLNIATISHGEEVAAHGH